MKDHKIIVHSIVKSSEKEGYAVVTLKNGKKTLRKVYDRKAGELAGRKTIDVEAEIYSFVWNGIHGTDFQFVKNYSTKGIGITKSIKSEMDSCKTKSIPAPVAELETKNSDPELPKHERYEEIKACIQNDIPVYLVGAAGSGKNFTLEQIAKELGLNFYYTNSVHQEYKLTGFIDAGGTYHETEFYRAMKNGGLFFLDEMDASIPEVLVLLNAAIANKYFEFPVGRVQAHKKFRVVAAGNTFGNGADEQYTGRLVLDQATLDRFVVIEFNYDKNVELFLAKGDDSLVDFIREMRAQATQKGIRATFSYRCIISVCKLKNIIPLERVLLISVFKGLDAEVIRTFNPYAGKNKYYEALLKIQGRKAS